MSAIFWHRRDLRAEDNQGLFEALSRGPVIGAFVFDPAILRPLPSDDRRVAFLWESLRELAAAYAARGGALFALHGDPRSEIPALAERLGAAAVFANRDYEPSAISRDAAVSAALLAAGRELRLSKDHVLFEEPEIRSAAGSGYSVFTPYKAAWIREFDLRAPPIAPSLARFVPDNLLQMPAPDFPSLEAIGFGGAAAPMPGGEAAAQARLAAFAAKIANYADRRDFPGAPATSRLGADLRFGTLSARSMAHWARSLPGEGAAVWLSELIWREFYSALLQRRPDLALGASFLAQFDSIRWRNQPADIEAWKSGQTGYPLVDAGMRELRATGFMHNRVRMVAASFLSKHLLCDWRIGEAHFARWLLDFDFASNNGGWQWAASTGSDPQPYFRIFNPVAQSEKFDPNGDYIRRWVPELSACSSKRIHAPWLMTPEEQTKAGALIGQNYPAPIVDHAWARLEALSAYKAAAGAP